jgi:uncharacterized protein
MIAEGCSRITNMNQIKTFLDNLLQEINDIGIDIKNLKIDHIAYSAASSDEYEKMLPKYSNEGNLVKEATISNRRVAVIKLVQPIKYKDYSVDVIEIIEPIENQESISGWEHAEFLVQDYDEVLKKYPDLAWNTKHKDSPNFSRIKLTLPSGLEVKFLDTPVLVSVETEN